MPGLQVLVADHPLQDLLEHVRIAAHRIVLVVVIAFGMALAPVNLQPGRHDLVVRVLVFEFLEVLVFLDELLQRAALLDVGGLELLFEGGELGRGAGDLRRKENEGD